MISSWYAGVTAQRKEEIVADFKSATGLRIRLEELLIAKINDSRKANNAKEAYNNPNWALRQADFIGYERALNEVITLLIDKSVEKT